ncbi:hypothetical protein [Providencia rettgeri]|uniref:phage tail fiber protein n=1 Tax=Providencia rettgeri TaxID=587 RepID=UPI0025733367|nr:hypothetical protein [Providencia rettgeri]MDL9981767.1 hypothetical protein [Providencia rettgeri]
MIYQTGTIVTTAGQTKIKGTGTRWKDNLAGISEGCPISYLINNVVYMNTVLSVNSDTEINLTYPVPVAASAAKYQIATFVLDSMSDGVRKMLANQQYIGYFLRNMDAWMTQDGIVEVKTPTGEIVKLESIRALKSLIDAKLDNSALYGYATTESVNSALNGYATTESVNSALNDKFDKKGGAISGAIDVGGNITSKNDVIQVTNERTGNNIQLDTTVAGRLRINTKPNGGTWLNHLLPAASGTLMQVGDYGVGATYTQQLIKITDYSSAVNQTLGFIYNDSGAISAPSAWGGGIRFGRDPKASSSILYSPDWNTRLFLSAGLANGKMSDWVEFYSTGNTTVDTQGNIKKASPVIKLFADSIDSNEEAEGVEMEHLGIGHYLIKGVIGFNADGAWGINNGFVIPQDHNGKNMVLIDYEVRPDGDIEVFVFHQQNADMPERFQNKRIKYFDEEGAPVYFENYEPCDVPESRWIDMRVEMPPNSIYNQKLAEAERLAKLEAERVAREEAYTAAS